MKEKLLQLMKSEGLTSSRMAELLEIQPSGISHILSGRNKPGFDLLQKILRRFPRVNPDWLLLESVQMYRTENFAPHTLSSERITPSDSDDLFGNAGMHGTDKQRAGDPERQTGNTSQQVTDSGQRQPSVPPEFIQSLVGGAADNRDPVVRVVLVYADQSFEALTPRKP